MIPKNFAVYTHKIAYSFSELISKYKTFASDDIEILDIQSMNEGKSLLFSYFKLS